jgi:hypothetical protein
VSEEGGDGVASGSRESGLRRSGIGLIRSYAPRGAIWSSIRVVSYQQRENARNIIRSWADFSCHSHG